MAETSRIKINPSTREIEIEGNEEFVRKYFNLIQKKVFAPQSSESRPASRNTDLWYFDRRRKGSNTDSVLNAIQENKDGITTGELRRQTGLDNRQIWSIIYKAERQGKIKRAKRGVYISS